MEKLNQRQLLVIADGLLPGVVGHLERVDHRLPRYLRVRRSHRWRSVKPRWHHPDPKVLVWSLPLPPRWAREAFRYL